MLVDDIGDVTVTNDGATILKLLEVQHPAAKVCAGAAVAACTRYGLAMLHQLCQVCFMMHVLKEQAAPAGFMQPKAAVDQT